MTSTEVAFPILGRSFRSVGVSSAVGEWLREFWEYPDAGAPVHAAGIRVHGRSSAPPATPDASPLSLALGDRTLSFTRTGQRWRAGDDQAGAELAIDGPGARIDIWGFDSARDPSSLYAALYVMIAEGLRISGLLPIHAAVAASPGGATAWLGASGTGKSTMLLRAAGAGWRPIAEDLSWLDPESLMVYGWDRAVRAWPDTLERWFPGLGGPSASDGKRLVAYADLGGASPRVGRLARIGLLQRDAGVPSRWEDVTSIDAVRALWEATGLPLSDGAREFAARAIGDVMLKVPVARLVLGSDPPPLERPVT